MPWRPVRPAVRAAPDQLNEKPSARMVSSEDAARIDLHTDDAGRFVDLGPIMGPLPVIENAALPAGTAMDGTPHRDATGTIDGSLWEHNEVALRAEMRVGGLAITRPAAFTVVDLVAPAA